MAAEQIKKVTGHLTCPICYELYKKPKYLPCYHSYCEECLVKLVVQSNITCPECRKTSDIPCGGVKQLPSNFFINRLLDEVALKRKVEGEEEVKCDLCVRGDAVEVLCLDCCAFLCHHCFENHKYSKEYRSHNTMPLNEVESKKEDLTIKPKGDRARCQKHEELELSFYCETCDQLVCQYCIMKDHLKHDHDTVKKMGGKHRKELVQTMQQVEKMIEGLSKMHKKTSDAKSKIKTHYDDVEKEIDRYYDELQEKLKKQRNELKKDLEETCAQKVKEVSLQLEQIEQTQAQLESIKELNGEIRKGSDQETLLMKKQLVDDVKRISDSYNKLDTQPVQSATMEFIPVEEQMPQFGQLFYDDDSCNFKALDIPRWAFLGTAVRFKLVSEDEYSQICLKGGNKIIVLAQSSRGGSIPVVVKDNKDGSYSASFMANQIGDVKLSVTIKGWQIKGSPFSIKVHGKYTTINRPSKVINEGGKMGKLWGIAFGRDGMWAIADSSNRCVWIFDSRDKLVKKFDTKGTNRGEYSRPLGIAFDADNKLYLTDSHNDRVQKFDFQGTCLLQFGSRGSGDGQMKRPMGMIVHSNKVYVVDSGGNRISVFHSDGKFINSFGSSHLQDPNYIAVNSNDQLLVTNCGSHCISMFSQDGKFISKFGTHGTEWGQLSHPSGIATDEYGFILVTEYNTHRVSVFDKHGVFIHNFGSYGSSPGQFSSPRGVAISPAGDIYICDMLGQRVQIF